MDLNNHLPCLPAGPAEARKVSIHHMCSEHQITIIRDGKGWAAHVQEGQRNIVTMFSLGMPHSLNGTQNAQTTHTSSHRGLCDRIRYICSMSRHVTPSYFSQLFPLKHLETCVCTGNTDYLFNSDSENITEKAMLALSTLFKIQLRKWLTLQMTEKHKPKISLIPHF